MKNYCFLGDEQIFFVKNRQKIIVQNLFSVRIDKEPIIEGVLHNGKYKGFGSVS